MQNIWTDIQNLEQSSIRDTCTRGSSVQFDETDKIAINDEMSILNQYIKLSPSVEQLVVNSDSYRQGSLEHHDDGLFTWFTNNGEYCVYSPRMRSDLRNIQPNIQDSFNESNNTTTPDGVVVLGPWYSYDKSFTNQYRNEAVEMAKYLNCNYNVISDNNVTVDTISKSLELSNLVIFDSHGISLNGTSYICITNSSGITPADYSSRHAINGGNWFGVDGTAIVNHSSNSFKCSLLWMAMCEGMKKDGGGGMAIPLNNNGVKNIYGYSQSVSFYGDYIYEKSFFESLRQNNTISDAFNKMTLEHGIKDPAFTTTGCAYPVIVSDVDIFPENPDSHQAVKSNFKFLSYTVKDIFSHGADIFYKSTTKKGKASFKIVYNNKEYGTLYINDTLNDASMNNINGTILIK